MLGEMLILLRISNTLEFLLFLEWLSLLFSYSMILLLLRLKEIQLLLICTSILITRLWDMLMLLLLFLSSLFLNSFVLLNCIWRWFFQNGRIQHIDSMMIENRDKRYFKSLELFQVTGHKAASQEVSTNIESMISIMFQILIRCVLVRWISLNWLKWIQQ